MSELIPDHIRKLMGIAGFIVLISSGCSPVATQSSPQPSPSPIPAQVQATTPPPTESSESPIPAGWVTHSSQRCEYAISYPSEMQTTSQGPHSQLIEFAVANPDDGARNFLYISVIDLEAPPMDEGEIYNYDSGEAKILQNLQVGGSGSLIEDPNLAAAFTYLRTQDTSIDGHNAQTYENSQPWEFPGGTKEIRYYLSLDGCTYLIGGYLDTTSSDQPGAIAESLFDQIIATIRVMP